MEDKLLNYKLIVPQNCAGEVVGKLNQHRGWLESVVPKDDSFEIECKMTIGDIYRFEQWLKIDPAFKSRVKAYRV